MPDAPETHDGDDDDDEDVASRTGDTVLRAALGMRPTPAPAVLQAGQVIDDVWRIEGTLGAGGMGVVYLAHDLRLGRRVAIKVHRVAIADRLRREASAMARLVHPNVVTVHHVGLWNEQPFVVMEYVPGRTARGWLTDAPRSLDAILDLYQAAGRGLAAAHAAGLVHCDFKPDNVLVGDDGRVRVADFGLAHRLDEGDGVDGSAVGTPAYMAPEQHRGGELGPAADQFAFAVALWEALCGTRPFPGDSVPALRAAIEAGRIRPPAPRVPRRIVAALTRALAVDPARRFPTLDDLLAALTPRRTRWVGWAAAAGAVAVGALGAVVVLGAERADAPPAWTPRIEAHLPSYDEDSYAPTLSPDGTRIAYASDRDQTSRFRLYIAPARGGPGRPVALPEGMNVAAPRWTDDGLAITFSDAAADYTAFRVPVDGGAPEPLSGRGAFVDDCAGRLLLGHLGSPDCTGCERLVLRDPDGREREVHRAQGAFFAASARCDHAGRRVVWAQREVDDPNSPADLWVLDLDGGAPRRILADGRANRRPIFHPDGRSLLFSSDRSGDLDIWELPLDGGEPFRITSVIGDEIGVDVATDGELLVFNLDDSSTPIFARDLFGAGRRRISQTRPQLFGLQITPDGREAISILTRTREVVAISLVDGEERVIGEGIAATVTPDGREIVYATREPTAIRAAPRAGGPSRTVGTVDGRVEVVRVDADGFVHLQVLRANAREAWRLPLAGGDAVREAPAPWAFVHPAPAGGWRMYRRFPGDRAPVGVLVGPGEEPDPAAASFVAIDGDWDPTGAAYLAYDLARLRRIEAATGAVRELFEVSLATGFAPSPDGETVYLTEQVARVRRYLLTNFADRR